MDNYGRNSTDKYYPNACFFSSPMCGENEFVDLLMTIYNGSGKDKAKDVYLLLNSLLRSQSVSNKFITNFTILITGTFLREKHIPI